ncbi:MAG: cyclodeaminase/cyclohydrolase family protein, partial [Chitinophagaceae bacterium]|nr:cyclodeaminase/cyclohydrolase family protein [Chitinophagaceae bacterium]
LATMVANLSSHKKGWDDRWEYFSDWAEKGQAIKAELEYLVDEDTASFNRIMEAFGLPKNSDEEKAARSAAIQAATLYATQIPLQTMKAAASAMPIAKAMVEEGNPNSVSDAGVGALCIRTAVYGAWMNVHINAGSLKDKALAQQMISEADAILNQITQEEAEIIALVKTKM